MSPELGCEAAGIIEVLDKFGDVGVHPLGLGELKPIPDLRHALRIPIVPFLQKARRQSPELVIAAQEEGQVGQRAGSPSRAGDTRQGQHLLVDLSKGTAILRLAQRLSLRYYPTYGDASCKHCESVLRSRGRKSGCPYGRRFMKRRP